MSDSECTDSTISMDLAEPPTNTAAPEEAAQGTESANSTGAEDKTIEINAAIAEGDSTVDTDSSQDKATELSETPNLKDAKLSKVPLEIEISEDIKTDVVAPQDSGEAEPEVDVGAVKAESEAEPEVDVGAEKSESDAEPEADVVIAKSESDEGPTDADKADGDAEPEVDVATDKADSDEGPIDAVNAESEAQSEVDFATDKSDSDAEPEGADKSDSDAEPEVDVATDNAEIDEEPEVDAGAANAESFTAPPRVEPEFDTSKNSYPEHPYASLWMKSWFTLVLPYLHSSTVVETTKGARCITELRDGDELLDAKGEPVALKKLLKIQPKVDYLRFGRGSLQNKETPLEPNSDLYLSPSCWFLYRHTKAMDCENIMNGNSIAKTSIEVPADVFLLCTEKGDYVRCAGVDLATIPHIDFVTWRFARGNAGMPTACRDPFDDNKWTMFK